MHVSHPLIACSPTPPLLQCCQPVTSIESDILWPCGLAESTLQFSSVFKRRRQAKCVNHVIVYVVVACPVQSSDLFSLHQKRVSPCLLACSSSPPPFLRLVYTTPSPKNRLLCALCPPPHPLHCLLIPSHDVVGNSTAANMYLASVIRPEKLTFVCPCLHVLRRQCGTPGLVGRFERTRSLSPPYDMENLRDAQIEVFSVGGLTMASSISSGENIENSGMLEIGASSTVSGFVLPHRS